MGYCANNECWRFAWGLACKDCGQRFCHACVRDHDESNSLTKTGVRQLRNEDWFLQWASRVRAGTCVLIDTRVNSAYAHHHLCGACNFPSDELMVVDNTYTRSTELPAATSGTILCLLSETSATLRAECADLMEGGFPVNLSESATDGEVPWTFLSQHQLVEQGHISRRLWVPSPSLTQSIDRVEHLVNHSPQHPASALDLGCGTGRDVIFLASRGWKVTAVDKARTFLDRCKAFADRALSGLPSGEVFANRHSTPPGALQSTVSALQMDLRPGKSDIKNLIATHALVNLARFMNRELLVDIAEGLQPGACVAVYHFAEGASSRTGRPFRKEGQTLDLSELVARFPSPTFEIILQEATYNVDGHRPMICFVARKRC